MGRDYFSLLWDTEEYYEEWLRNMAASDKEYIFDLNLEYVYDEVRRWGGFGDNYDFRDIFLYPCVRDSTIKYRQAIMERLYADTGLYEIAVDIMSCISDAQKRREHICGIHDGMKKKIFYLQMMYEFLSRMGGAYTGLTERIRISPRTHFAAGIRSLGEGVTGCGAERMKKQLYDCLCLIRNNTPSGIILNMDENRTCRNAVVCPIDEGSPSITDRLRAAASVFLEDYEYSVRVYQDMDITCLDKKIQEYILKEQPGLAKVIEELYESCKEGFDFWHFIQLANELVFYLSCIRFRVQYERRNFHFSMPVCEYGPDTKVHGAYDMVLGINLFRRDMKFGAVSNDFRFDDNGRIFILTGANQGGKTTFIRSVGLVQHLAQIGMFVPAREAVIRIVGRIHTHFSRDDEEDALVGRFEQELGRMRGVLDCLEDGDMVLLNEAFTSTQRTGAVALLCCLLEEFDKRRCVGGLVTHYYEILDELKGDGFYSLSAEVAGDGGYMRRTFKIVRTEPYRQSYARNIAVKCGVIYENLIQVLEDGKERGDGDALF